jgi:hypothetical protein
VKAHLLQSGGVAERKHAQEVLDRDDRLLLALRIDDEEPRQRERDHDDQDRARHDHLKQREPAS